MASTASHAVTSLDRPASARAAPHVVAAPAAVRRRAAPQPRPHACKQRRALQRRAQASDAPSGVATAADAPAFRAADGPLVYSGVVFDMDGTLTVSNIDYVTMRAATGIPQGDLFTVMESWDEGDRIKAAMDVILGLEAAAAADLRPMPGLLQLLSFLRASGARVGLVTRNTTESLNAFFGAIGEEWRAVFDVVLTRDNTPHVKPDSRTLLHFAQAWGMEPWELLMVGDSGEDVETANAAGTASCFITGGGNETSAAAAAPPPRGAVPTFTVDSLADLQRRLAARDTALGWGAPRGAGAGAAAAAVGAADGEQGLAGAPPDGLDFLRFALASLSQARCSFPRIDGARFGTPPDEHPGDRVLHLGCGDGALTKLLFSSGLQVVGVDEDVAAAQRRGLPAVQLRPLALGAGALEPELRVVGALFDAAVFYAQPCGDAGSGGDAGGERGDAGGLSGSWWRAESLAELRRVLRPGGKLCVQAPVPNEAAVRQQLAAAGFEVVTWEDEPAGCTRLVAASQA